MAEHHYRLLYSIERPDNPPTATEVPPSKGAAEALGQSAQVLLAVADTGARSATPTRRTPGL